MTSSMKGEDDVSWNLCSEDADQAAVELPEEEGQEEEGEEGEEEDEVWELYKRVKPGFKLPPGMDLDDLVEALRDMAEDHGVKLPQSLRAKKLACLKALYKTADPVTKTYSLLAALEWLKERYHPRVSKSVHETSFRPAAMAEAVKDDESAEDPCSHRVNVRGGNIRVEDLVDELEVMTSKAHVKLPRDPKARREILEQTVKNMVDEKTKNVDLHEALEVLKQRFDVVAK